MSPEQRALDIAAHLTYFEDDGEVFYRADDGRDLNAADVIAEALRQAVAEEREACAEEAEARVEFYGHNWRMAAVARTLAQVIRARAVPPVVTTIPDLTIPKGGDPFSPEVIAACEKALSLAKDGATPPAEWGPSPLEGVAPALIAADKVNSRLP